MSDRAAQKNRIWKKVSASAVFAVFALTLSGCTCTKSDFSDYIPKVRHTEKREIYVDTESFREDVFINPVAEVYKERTARKQQTENLIAEAQRLCSLTACETQATDIDLLLASIRLGEAVMVAEASQPVVIEEYTLPLAGISMPDTEHEERKTANGPEEKLEELRALYPDGAYWNYGGVTNSPCRHHEAGYYSCNSYGGKTSEFFGKDEGIQCLGFASMISDLLFGEDAEVRELYSFDDLRIGDHIRIEEDGFHSLTVIGIDGDTVRVVECNSDCETCMISWDGEYGREYLEDVGARYVTRYPVR